MTEAVETDEMVETLRASLTEKNHRLHPAAGLLPKMSDEEYEALKEDIRTKGLRDPITLTADGSILDGRHRQRACDETGVQPRYDTYRGRDPIGYVLSKNLRRRHLTQSQLGVIAVEAEAMYAEAAAKRRDEGRRRGGLTSPNSSTIARRSTSERPKTALGEAAKAVGVSAPTAERAKRVKKEDPDLYEKVKEGEVTVTAAVDQLKQRDADPEPNGSKSRAAVAKRRERIREMAGSGYTSDQIAGEVGMAEETVRQIARDEGITIVADKVVGSRRRIDSNRVVEETSHAVEGLAIGVELVDLAQLDRERLAAWATSLSNSLRPLNRLAKQLKEMARG